MYKNQVFHLLATFHRIYWVTEVNWLLILSSGKPDQNVIANAVLSFCVSTYVRYCGLIGDKDEDKQAAW